jgi:hypothetical protein
MPVRCWRNLSKAELISSLVREAGRRVDEMIEREKFVRDLRKAAQRARAGKTA